MIVALLQADLKWNDRRANIENLDRMINGCEDADLYIMPEMFSTGFAPNPVGIAEDDGFSLGWMQRKAHETDAALCGSVAVEHDGRFYNRCYFVEPDGRYYIYDKRHLFAYGKEDLNYQRGQERVIVEWKGVRILLQTCYDLRFPVFSRNKKDYDMAVYVASWPESRHDVWTTLLKARALENQCYVAGVNRVGDDPQCHYKGGSVVINPYGKYLAHCDDDSASSCTAEIDMNALISFRLKFPVLEDADQFNIV